MANQKTKNTKMGSPSTTFIEHPQMSTGKNVVSQAKGKHDKFRNKSGTGFTLIELLVVIAIIGILSSLVLASLNSARTKARDSKRLSDMKQVQIALEFYYDKNGQYPEENDTCQGWDIGNKNSQLLDGKLTGFMDNPPNDSVGTGWCDGYRYHRYPAGGYSANCDTTKGAFYVLGVTDMETSNGIYPSSPGWSCPGRDWRTEMEWVAGGFEY